MHNTIAHQPLTDAQPAPKQQSAASYQLPPVYTPSMTFYGMEYPFG